MCTVWMDLALFSRYNGDNDVCSCTVGRLRVVVEAGFFLRSLCFVSICMFLDLKLDTCELSTVNFRKAAVNIGGNLVKNMVNGSVLVRTYRHKMVILNNLSESV